MNHPPGWYPSPHYADSLQYWDGNGWTSSFKKMEPKSSDRVWFKILAGVLLMFGVIPLLFTAPSVFNSIAPGSSQSVITGTVIEVDMNTMKRNDGHAGWVDKCRSTAEYTLDGIKREAKSRYYEYPCKWKVGDSVDVVYYAERPESQAFVGELDGGPTSVTWTFFGIGSALILSGVSIMTFAFRRRKAA